MDIFGMIYGDFRIIFHHDNYIKFEIVAYAYPSNIQKKW